MNNQIDNNFNEDDQIDIIFLLKTLWNGKKLIVKTTILFFVIGCVVALLSPVVYTSETTFVPQVSDDQMPSPKRGIVDAYKDIIPTIFKQSKDKNYFIEVELPKIN